MEEQSQVQQPEVITINDLKLIKELIDITTTRGAYKANELATVGTIYNKLSTFIDAALKQMGETQETTTTEE